MSPDDERELPAPFASDARGELFVTSDGARLFAWIRGRVAPIWTFGFTAPAAEVGGEPAGVFRRPAERSGTRVVGLRVAAGRVLAVDERGVLVCLSRTGERLWTYECRVEAFALLAVRERTWAVLHRRGVVIGRGATVVRRLELAEPCCGTFADEGNFLALGTRDGRLIVTPVELGSEREVALGGLPSGVAWVGRHGWLASLGDAIVRVDPSYATVERVWVDGAGLEGIVAANSRVCAARRGRHGLVVLAHLDRVRLASVDFAPRSVGELELSAWPRVGAALDGGGFVCLDLEADRLARRPIVRREGPGSSGAALVSREAPRIELHAAALAAERSRELRPRRERSKTLYFFVLIVSLIALAAGAC